MISSTPNNPMSTTSPSFSSTPSTSPSGAASASAHVTDVGAAGSTTSNASTNASANAVPPPVDGLGTSAALMEHAKLATQSATALYQHLGSTIEEARKVVVAQLEARPLATLSAAAGAGYVLAGGLASPVTRMGMRVATKAAMAYLLKELAEKALHAAEDMTAAAKGEKDKRDTQRELGIDPSAEPTDTSSTTTTVGTTSPHVP